MTATTALTNEALAALFTSPDVFDAWLASKDPETVVGTARCASRCPITAFVSEHFALPIVNDWHKATPGTRFVSTGSVTSTIYPVEDGGQVGDPLATTVLPGWAQRFIRGVDGTPGFYETDVTAADCRERLAIAIDQLR